MSDPLFIAENHHVESCGKPPAIAAGNGRVVSYFENELGEQMIFVHERGAQTATIYHGDCQWNSPMIVSVDGIPPDQLTQVEKVWALACMMVMSRRLGLPSGRHTMIQPDKPWPRE